jgi:hypothetical protein
MSMTPDPDLKPGDEAEPGTPGAGEDLCEPAAAAASWPTARPARNAKARAA